MLLGILFLLLGVDLIVRIAEQKTQIGESIDPPEMQDFNDIEDWIKAYYYWEKNIRKG